MHPSLVGISGISYPTMVPVATHARVLPTDYTVGNVYYSLLQASYVMAGHLGEKQDADVAIEDNVIVVTIPAGTEITPVNATAIQRAYMSHARNDEITAALTILGPD